MYQSDEWKSCVLYRIYSPRGEIGANSRSRERRARWCRVRATAAPIFFHIFIDLLSALVLYYYYFYYNYYNLDKPDIITVTQRVHKLLSGIIIRIIGPLYYTMYYIRNKCSCYCSYRCNIYRSSDL